MGEESGKVGTSATSHDPRDVEAAGCAGTGVVGGMAFDLPSWEGRPYPARPSLPGNPDPGEVLRTLRSLRSIAHRDAPTPANLVDWARCLLRADVAPLFRRPGHVSHHFERALRDDLAHMLRRGNGSGAFRVGDEAAAVRFALDVMRAIVLSAHSADGSASLDATAMGGIEPERLLDGHMLLLLRAWRHVGSYVRD